MKIWNKKGQNILDTWPEILTVVLLIIGFFVSISLGSMVFTYIVISLIGFMAGRFLRYRKTAFPFYLIIFGLLLGFVLGARYGNWKVMIFLFALFTAISWYLHEKKILK